MAAAPSSSIAVKCKRGHSSKGVFIQSLQPHHMMWNMDVKIIAKSPIYVSKDGNKKSFCAYLLDAQSDEIRCTFYDKYCDLHYDNLQVNTIHNLANCKVITPNPHYNDMQLQWELKFHNKSLIVENKKCHISTFVLHLDCVDFSAIRLMDDNSIVDCVGIVWCVGDVETIIKKADPNKDKTYTKRDIELIDLEHNGMSVSVWDNNAVLFDESKEYTVVAMKRIKVTSFENVEKLTTLPSTIFIYDYQGCEEMTAHVQRLREELHSSDSSEQLDSKQSFLNIITEEENHEASGSSSTNNDAERCQPSPKNTLFENDSDESSGSSSTTNDTVKRPAKSIPAQQAQKKRCKLSKTV